MQNFDLPSLFADHAPGFVLTAVAAAALSGVLAGHLRCRVAKMPGVPWLILTAVTVGVGVWTTHFVAMLGYRTQMHITYGLLTTILSALTAICLIGLPLAISACIHVARWRTLLGVFAGSGISAMHYLGMRAMHGSIMSFSVVSVAVAVTIGSVCLAALCRLSPTRRSVKATALLFTIGVCGTHFTAMAGMDLHAFSTDADHTHHLSLAIIVAVGTAVLLVGSGLTILGSRRLEALEQAHAFILSLALDNMSNGLIYFDAANRIRLWNSKFLSLYGLAAAADLTGMTPEQVVDLIATTSNWTVERRDKAVARFRDWRDCPDTDRFEYAHSGGRALQVQINRFGQEGFVATFDEVTTVREAEKRIEDLSFRDPLTRLPNRRALSARMAQDLAKHRRFKLLLIDIERFRSINESHGPAFGDELLAKVAERLRRIARPDTFVARLGGNEFAMIVYGELDQAEGVARRVTDAFAIPYRLGAVDVTVGCSIGICRATDAATAADLLQFADIALDEAKRHRRGQPTTYTHEMLEQVTERVNLEADLRGAIERGEMHLAFQPVFGIAEDRVIGYEALIRWIHPTRGNVSPARFIPLAEETGQIVEIGAWVLREACRQIAALPGDLRVAVNVSPVQFRASLLDHMLDALRQSGLPPHRLEIELTETAMVEDGLELTHLLGKIRKIGVSIAMDDFGTGYSSLSHLRDFPIDRIKLDRSFVSTAASDTHSLAVLTGIIHIGRALGVSILAEGVETAEQFQLMCQIGCDAIQGYYIGKPASLALDSSVSKSSVISPPPLSDHQSRLGFAQVG